MNGGRHIVVAGAGMAGLASALVLARAGHRVTLVERDSLEPAGSWASAFAWARHGIAHFHQPHAFIPRGRKLLRQVAPEVYAAPLEAGAIEVEVGRKVPGEPLPEDADLVYLGVRRPLIEWGLRRAVLAEPRVAVRAGVRVVGLVGERGPLPRVHGVRTAAGETVVGDLLVDALGRTSPVPDWLGSLGGHPPEVTASETGLIYYSRYFQLRPGTRFPDGPWLLGPRGDLGYASFNTFRGDNRTFAIAFGVPTWDRELCALLRPDAVFLAACRAVPALAGLVAEDLAAPITPVLPMGSLQNTLRVGIHDEQPVALGLFPVGDACCHTNPAFALGLSMSLLHPMELARVLAEHPGDPRDQALAYWAAILPEARERYELVRSTDDARQRVWRGERLDPSKRTGCFPLFMLVATGVASMRDAEVFRRTVRRTGFLDRTAAFDGDVALQERVERLFADALAAGPPTPPGPPRDELLDLLAKTTGLDREIGPLPK